MGNKIFVSYKYKDTNVAPIKGQSISWPYDYVDYIQDEMMDKLGGIYKGEKSDEDISYLSDAQIWEHLKPKLYDSTVTIVLVSPNMKEPNRLQKSQWIPQEISYSVKLTTRGGRTSQRNALLVVVLPDKNGSFNYYDKNNLFPILKSNIDNGYAFVTTWNEFVNCPLTSVGNAIKNKDNVPDYKIVKSL